MARSTIACVLAVLGLCATAFSERQTAINEHLYTVVGRADGTRQHRMTLWVKLVEGADSQCDQQLRAVSLPGLPTYGQHLSFSDMAQFSDMNRVAAVEKWLRENAVSSASIRVAPNGEFVEIVDTISNFETLFESKFYDFALIGNAAVKRTASRAEVPEAIAEHIDFIVGLNKLPHNPPEALAMRPIRTNAYDYTGIVTPEFLYTYYGLGNPQSSSASSMSIYASLGQSFDPSDLRSFQDFYNIESTPVSQVVGENDPNACYPASSGNCDEADLDVEYISAMNPGGNLTFWSIPAGIEDGFLAWIEDLVSMEVIPFVHSISYGAIAQEIYQTDKARLSLEICKVGLRGATIFVASGDDGVANFNARNDPSQCGFNPSFPATCPYVTAVGATQGPESGNPEIACSSATNGIITSGGGFSVFYAIPDYQAEAVQNYLQNAPNLPPLEMFNSSGRAYPDVSWMGYNYNVTVGGSMIQLSGTSCASPSFAGMIALVNNQRIAAGSSPVGFLNHALYSSAFKQAFNDITVGENNCCAFNGQGNLVCCQYGFNATTGWDPVTGLGTPIYGTLSGLLLSL